MKDLHFLRRYALIRNAHRSKTGPHRFIGASPLPGDATIAKGYLNTNQKSPLTPIVAASSGFQGKLEKS